MPLAPLLKPLESRNGGARKGAIDIDLPKSLKRGVPANVWAISYWHYAAHMQNPLAQELVAASKAGGDPYPHAFTALGHSGIMGYAGAIQAVQGTGTDNVIAALEGLKFDSVRGPTVFRREDHQAISSQNIVRWEPSEAEPGWKSAEFVTVSDADVVNPPAPGTKWVD